MLPSLSEGNPTVMFEALGCGKAFIGTDVGGIPEIIINSNYGFIAPRKNSKALSIKIIEGLNKRWDKKKILEYSKKFTWGSISENIVENYQDLI